MKALHSVFYILIFFLSSSSIIQWISEKSKCFFSTNEKKFRQRETTRKTGLFSKKILPLIVNGSGCVLLPCRCGLPLIVNGSGCALLPLRCGLPLIVNGSGCALLPFRYRLPLIVNGSGCALLPLRYRLPLIVNGSGCALIPFRCGLPLIVNGSGMRASSLPVRTSVNR